MSIKSRLDRLERERGQQGGCSACQGAHVVHVFDDGLGDGPQPEPAPCPRCGAEPAVVVVHGYASLDGVKQQTDSEV